MIEIRHGANRDDILALMQDNPDIDLENARFCIEKSDSVVVYKDASNKPIGCGTFRLWGEKKNKADVYIYVMPQMRGSDVGEMLFQSLTDNPQRNMLAFISTRIETNCSRSIAFFRKKGFEEWYTELTLRHSGERQPESGIEPINYSSEYFEKYVNAMRSSFYELRRANDFQPYYCCNADEEKKRELERKKDSIFLLMDESEIAASVMVDGDSIEDVFVTPAYQGKGIGKKLMQFAINKAIDRGSKQIRLDAIAWNSRALHLYESVGFHIAKTVYFMRLFQ